MKNPIIQHAVANPKVTLGVFMVFILGWMARGTFLACDSHANIGSEHGPTTAWTFGDQAVVQNWQWAKRAIEQCADLPIVTSIKSIDEMYQFPNGQVDIKRAAETCAWLPPAGTGYTQAPAQSQRTKARLLVAFFGRLWSKYRIVSIERAGGALGAYRAGGQVPGDVNSDHWVLVPKGVSVDCLGAMMKAETQHTLKEMGAAEGTELVIETPVPWPYTNKSPRSWQLGVIIKDANGEYDSGGTAIELAWMFEDAYSTFMSTKLPRRADGSSISIHPKRALSNLCTCRFFDLPVFCFEKADMEEYLAQCYGPDFMTPRPDYKGEDYDPKDGHNKENDLNHVISNWVLYDRMVEPGSETLR